MAISIRTNLSSINGQRWLSRTQRNLETSLSKLSSGLRVRSAADDAAGLAISEKMKAQIRSLKQAERNANDGISLIQTADGALNEIHSIMDRLRELAIQSANGVLEDNDRNHVNDEFKELIEEIDRIAQVTEFNGHKLLDGSQLTGIDFQVGINNTANDRITVTINSITASALSNGGHSLATQSVSTITKALNALDVIDAAINQVSVTRSKLGATQNRLVVTINNITTYRENLSAANSRIRDVDVAEESSEMTRLQILQQSGIAVLAQANQMPSVALNLIGGG